MSEEAVITIAQQVWDKIDGIQKIAVYFNADDAFLIDISVGVAITRKELKRQTKRFDLIHDMIHGMGFSMANDGDGHPPNKIGKYFLDFWMAGDIGVRDSDPDLIKLFTKGGGEGD